MQATINLELTNMELVNIKYALLKRVRGMKVYMEKTRDLKKEPLINRDIRVCQDLLTKVEDKLKNGARTWSTSTT